MFITKKKLGNLIDGKSSETLILPQPLAQQINRRQLLSGGVSLAAYATLGGLLNPGARAQTAAGDFTVQKKLVWVNLRGGWDILESVDPKPTSTSGIDVAYPWAQAHTIAGSSEKLGRWMPNLAALGDEVLPIRGILMQTTSHMAGSVYMETGILSNNGRVNAASIPAIVASESKQDVIIPIIQLSGGSAPLLDRGIPKVSTVRAQNLSLYRRMYPADDSEKQVQLAVLDYLKNSATAQAQRFGTDNDRYDSVVAAESKIRSQIEENVSDKMQVSDEDRTPYSQAMSSSGLTGNNGVDAFALAGKLIKQDIVNVVTLGFGGFDTHANQTARLQGNMQRVDALVAALASDLKSANKLDSTLIVLYSDFSRTPKINNSNGRDHWPVGGSLFVGGGIQGGRAVGASDDNMQSVAVDYSSGNLTDATEDEAEDTTQGFIKPTHIGGSVLELCLGQNYLDLRTYLQSLPILTQLKS